ncbi:hypothetical protein OHB26_07385 [Nocardia sp. NBC_01503]|uniref:hypothetical protein n=1 Tax=Nocardia sp. NBC_01503 TaxID=2975997 RepID=UPI002E7C38D2|nr:hypothetical protein [Nocardia sp. NBC_01503]WTL34030.1 hypothetical protein OHB26_07385 [Nocardia sp. NBC_01503]
MAGAVFATTVGANSASAVTPIIDPGKGIYLAVLFDRGETAALNNSPIPGLLDRVAPDGQTLMFVDPASRLPQDEDVVYASVPDVVAEAAVRNGVFGIGWYNPADNAGYPVRVVEILP